MMLRLVFSFLTWLLMCVPLSFLSVPVVAILLLTKWDGKTTWFGNEKWGRGTDHFAFPTKGFWQEFNWLVLRNPVYNFAKKVLSAPMSDYILTGDDNIGDKIAGGFYKIEMDKYYEYYWIYPYTIFGSKRCIRVRVGWKINENADGEAMFTFTINPWKAYKGV